MFNSFNTRSGSIPLTGPTIKLPVVDTGFGTHKVVLLTCRDGSVIGHPTTPQSATFGPCGCWLHTQARNLSSQNLALAYSVSLGAVCLVRITKAVTETHVPWHDWTTTVHTLADNGGGLVVRSGSFPSMSRAKQKRDQDIARFYTQVLAQHARIRPK